MTKEENSVLEAQAWVNKAIDELSFITPESSDEEDRIYEVICELETIEEIVAGLFEEIKQFRKAGGE